MGNKVERLRKQLQKDARWADRNRDDAEKQDDASQVSYWEGARNAFDRSVAHANEIIGA